MKTIYYNEKGQIDRLTTYINNHDWVVPVVFWGCIIIGGIVEAM